MKRIAIIGGGISGLSVGQMLKDDYGVRVFERESTPGGLIRCKRINGSLFHICGGHVFNTKNDAVRNWFWNRFNRNTDFIKADRKSAVLLDGGKFVDYPIENHVWQMDESVQRGFYADVQRMLLERPADPDNFGDFLLSRFGKTLYDLYFKPYNMKIWRRDLSTVPLSWLQGKLPMPTPQEMLAANQQHLEEKSFVHSTFYYERRNGSQFIADTLASGLDVVFNTDVQSIQSFASGGFLVDGERFDGVVFCGNLKELPAILAGIDLGGYLDEIRRLESHGTTAVFCETEPIPYSWFYQPSSKHQSHRFICTGNFSPTNNAPGRMTCTVEFTDEISRDEIASQLRFMPYSPSYLAHHYSPYTYPIQHSGTRTMIGDLKKFLQKKSIYLIGRFAEWEYFNMDAAIASAMDGVEEIRAELK